MLYLQATEAEQNVDHLMSDEDMIKEQELLFLKISKSKSTEESCAQKEEAQLEETKEQVIKPEAAKPIQVDAITEMKKKVGKDVFIFECIKCK